MIGQKSNSSVQCFCICKNQTLVNFDDYFEDIIGVTRPKDSGLKKVLLHFTSNLAPYILTKPLHGSQRKISHDENGLVVQLEVIPNYELEQLVLSYGEAVKVVEPKGLRGDIQERLKLSLDNYLVET